MPGEEEVSGNRSDLITVVSLTGFFTACNETVSGRVCSLAKNPEGRKISAVGSFVFQGMIR
jgi:hypothetical protein